MKIVLEDHKPISENPHRVVPQKTSKKENIQICHSTYSDKASKTPSNESETVTKSIQNGNSSVSAKGETIHPFTRVEKQKCYQI